VTAIDLKTRWKFHWLTRWTEIWDEGFVLQWQTWLAESPTAHVFFHPALVKAWVETYLPLRDIRPCFLIAESDANMVFLPMVLWRRNWKNAFQRLLVPVGYSDYDYNDPIISYADGATAFDSESFWVYFNEELSTACPFNYDRILLDGIRSGFSGKGNRWTERETCTWTDLTPFQSPEVYLPSLKSSLRGDLRRQERRMQETGEINYLVFEESMGQKALKELIPFLNAHSRRWPEAYKAPRFHEHLIIQGMEAGILHFSVLRIGGDAVAWHLGFIYRDRFYYYLPAQKEEFDRLSPGKVLLLRCVEDAIARGLTVFDHLRGEENYKAGWTDKTETLWSLQLDGNHPTSRIRNVVVDRAKPGLKTLLPTR
jgi:CelD/BcsL family acetyltransferase involved in cellulose biosynthesis